LQDFFKDETVFVAYGSERCSVDDFELSSNGKLQITSLISSQTVEPHKLQQTTLIEKNTVNKRTF